MIAITGAAGKTGTAIIRRLSASGVSVRALAHHGLQTEPLLESGASAVVVGDLLDPRALLELFSGCEAVYHICPNVHPDELAIGQAVVDAARAADVERLVYHSVLFPEIEAMPHHWQKHLVEALMTDAGLKLTILRPTAYMQNILAQRSNITDRGYILLPYAAESIVTMVDLEDVAEAADNVLTEPGHVGHIYDLCGSETLDCNAIAAVLSRELEQSVLAQVQSRAAWLEQAAATGLGDYQQRALVAMFRYYERHGMRGDSRDLEALLRRAPTKLAEVIGREM